MKQCKHKLSATLLCTDSAAPSRSRRRSRRSPIYTRKPSQTAAYRYRALCRLQSNAKIPPVLRPLDFFLDDRRPLVPMHSLCVFLNKTVDQVLELIEEGKLAWAFDIRSSAAGRREVRVLRKSMFDFAGVPSVQVIESDAQVEADYAKVMDFILPAGFILSPAAFQSRKTQPARPPMSSLHHKLRLPASCFHNLLFPQEPVLRSIDVARYFSCNPQHILNLIDDKLIQSVPFRRGPKSSPLVTRSSVVEFLKSRRMS